MLYCSHFRSAPISETLATFQLWFQRGILHKTSSEFFQFIAHCLLLHLLPVSCCLCYCRVSVS